MYKVEIKADFCVFLETEIVLSNRNACQKK